MTEDLVHLSLQKPPEFLFFAIGDDSVDDAMRHGLNRLKTPFIEMYEEKETARRKLRKPTIFLVAVLARWMAEDGYFFSHAETGEWLTEEIPPKYLRLQ